ncbi:unclassified [Brachyspira pilosicoli WesB]|uniref:Unclassified n=1 Tax=Brachyspira pilosicoli WesB TaxID=1161918 RepID=K0JIU9_BRAPL|nr:hypothetical protein [Brachyspira pilosicoli]PLV61155.1 hypothetical protein BPSP16_06420 [Brachyspira pilosicoli SP16]CCG56839.1 unclassified [Brachyspira pilosicoli WesB]
MATRTGYYIVEDITKSGIYHIYEVTNIERDKYYKIISFEANNYPICCDDDDLYLSYGYYKLYTEAEVINFIRNILNGIQNPFRLCENCIRKIIAEKQDKFFKNNIL